VLCSIRVRISLIAVPYHAGDEHRPSARGPARLLEAGAVERAAARGVEVSAETIERGEPFRDTGASSAAVNARLAVTVRKAVEAGQLPIVLTGSCNSAMGVLAGFDHRDCGAVWLDAHGDFNTPESTVSGFLPGMSLAIVTGHCYRDYWATMGDSTPLAEESVVMFGVRDLSPSKERERLERSAIEVIGWRDGRPLSDPLAALDQLRRRVSEVYLHVDLDAFAPDVAPAIADQPVPGGLSLEDGEAIVSATIDRFRLRAATIATYAPAFDQDDKTLHLALRLIELIAAHPARRS
jgi:arginase